MWCDAPNWKVIDQNSTWATACYYHTVQLAVGGSVFLVFPVAYFILIQYYSLLATVTTQRSVVQVSRVLLSVLLVILSWSEAFYCISDYFKSDDVQIAGLLSPVIFSFLPFATIFIQLEERKYTRDGSGIVLLLHFVSFCAFLPAMLTATHKYTSLSLLHDADQLQRALKFCIWTGLLLLVSIIAQILPDNVKNACGSPDEKYLLDAWEERATLLSRIFFHWFSKVISQSTKETITADNLPGIPNYLKCETSFKHYREEWQLTDPKMVFIKPSQSKGKGPVKGKDVKGKDEEKGSSKEKAALIVEENGTVRKSSSKEDAKKSDLPKEGTICSQRSILSTLIRCYWRPVVVAAVFKFLHDILSFANPQILKRFIQWVESDSTARQEGLMLALMLFTVAATQTLLLHQYFLCVNSTGLTVRLLINALAPVYFGERAIVNLIG